MAIEKTYLLGKNITLGCGFDLQAKAPLDSRQVVPEYDGLQALIDGNAAYEGMIVYDEGTKKTYQAQLVDGVLAFREFGINEAELKALIASETTAAMEFKGAATALPENPSKGDFYKVTAEIEVAEDETAKVGDSIVYDGEQWFIIPSGDDIEDTWRPVTDVDNDSALTFVAGDKLDVTVAADGTITYKHEAIDAPEDVTAEGDEQTRTYITAVETDGFGHITGYKTATENVEDTNTTYEFEGQSDEATSVYFQVTSSEEGASAEVIYLDAYSKNEANELLKGKVDTATLSNYKTKQDAYEAPEAEDASESDKIEFISNIAQDENGEISATKQSYDLGKFVTATTFEDTLSERFNPVAEDIAELKGVVGIGDDNEGFGLLADVEDIEEALGFTGDENGDYRSVNERISDATSELIGKDTDEATANTIYGVKKYADKAIEDANLGQYAKTADLGDLATVDTITADKVTDFATEVAKVKVDEAVKADEATKAAQDGNGKVIADTYAEKATTLAGYGISDAYTKTEVDGVIDAAKTDASNKDAVVLSEAQKYAEGKVNALAGNVYTKEQTYTQDEVDALISAAHSWGEF